MDSIRKLRIKHEDGTYSNSIPIGASSDDIFMTSGGTLTDSMSDVEEAIIALDKTNDTQGESIDELVKSVSSNTIAIQNQKDVNEKQETKMENFEKALAQEKVYVFNNVYAMKNANNLKAGMYCITKGYYTPNDGGGASYEIIDNNDTRYNTLTDDGGSVHDLENGNKAVLNIGNKYKINIKFFGWINKTYSVPGYKTYPVKDISISLQKAIDFLVKQTIVLNEKLDLIIYIPADAYWIGNTINCRQKNIYLEGDSLGNKNTAIYIRDMCNKIYTQVDGPVFENGTHLYVSGLNFENTIGYNEALTEANFTSMKPGTIKNCFFANYDVCFADGINAVGLIENNQFLGCRKYFIRGTIVDSFINDNYINGFGQNAICFQGICNMSVISNNFIDFFYKVQVTDTINTTTISDNIIDYCYIGFDIGGVEGLTIANNKFTHMNKQHYDNGNNRYDIDSDPATKDWTAIILRHTQKSVEIIGNTCNSVDLFISCNNPVPNAFTSIHTSNNSMTYWNQSGDYANNKFIDLLAVYSNSKYNDKLIFEELNYSEYTVMPSHQNTYNQQYCYYNNIKYQNQYGTLKAVGIKNYEDVTSFNFKDPSTDTSKFSIDLHELPNAAEKNEIYLHLSLFLDSYLPYMETYKIMRISNAYYCEKIYNTHAYDFIGSPKIEQSTGILTMNFSGTNYERINVTKTVKYYISSFA